MLAAAQSSLKLLYPWAAGFVVTKESLTYLSRSAAGPASSSSPFTPWQHLIRSSRRQLTSTTVQASFVTSSKSSASAAVLARAELRARLHAAVQYRQQAVADLVQQRRLWEARGTALVNSLSSTVPGQAVMGSLIPLAVLAGLLTRSAACEAAAPIPPALRFKRPHRPFLVVLKQRLVELLEEILINLRALYLGILFTPILASAPMVFYLGLFRPQWMWLLCWTLERAGPAFIKWGQWSSTRPDLFPPDVCQSLEQLQTSAPQHPGEYSMKVIESAFNRPLYQLFDHFEEHPVASGSIAQIHKARLSAGAAGRSGCRIGQTVAVKVRHPGVTLVMQRDFILMQRIAYICGHIPGLSNLRLEESVRQFGGPLKEQLDLSVEASHLDRFRKNFRLWPTVTFPRPIRPFVAPDVLVESFEEGSLVSVYVNGEVDAKHNHRLAELGMNLYLQMLLKDNFIHADLHPGNILVREVDLDRLKGVARLIGGWFEYEPNLVLLDVGMIAELSDQDQASLIGFFKALTQQDGEGIARAMLSMSEKHTCKDPDAFIADLKDMFQHLDAEYIRIYTAAVFQEMIERLRNHHVTLRSTVSTVVVTTLVLEGWSSKLNPDLRILDTMRSILATDWSSRISAVVERIMTTGTLAV